ncbi:MAG: NAD(P)/FAD-dependent oxidoreductase [Candidatus Freyarchaeota archaeon]|nr:NAD(P)/FAD-dependent oxidoreductase [Candidatus Jordarchaeia archaeon]
MKSDVVVVGCGPAGSLASLEAARKGVEVLILEEHKAVGEPDHCAGLVSISGLKRLDLRVPEECVLNRVYGARFFSPSGVTFTVRRRTAQAVVLDRRRFDRWLASLAHDAGAHVILGEKVDFFMARPEEAVVAVKGGEEVRGEVVVDAEGCRGRVARLAGLPRPVGRLPAVQFELAGVDGDEDFVELHFGSTFAPGFFAWVIPIENGVRVGLGAYSRPGERLKAFIKRRGLSDCKVIRKITGVIITGGPVKRTYASRIITVGDAAGQVKPTTGGGVVTGGICARVAGRVVAEAILEGKVGKPLRAYERTWRGILGREFFFMGLARKFLNKVSDRGLDVAFSAIREHGGTEVLETYGDMDFESEALKRLLVNPYILLRSILHLIV